MTSSILKRYEGTETYTRVVVFTTNTFFYRLSCGGGDDDERMITKTPWHDTFLWHSDDISSD